ncbi:MAG: sugar transferase [Terracidiphilus sp.]|jgi:lipopolysaccharide/colanic/teichoic acid biosynthesis glycosyltransferase
MQLSSPALESSVASAPAIPIASPPPVLDRAPARQERLQSPSASGWSLSASKRLLDFSIALLVFAVFGVPMLAIVLCVRLSSRGPALFAQQRVGRGGRLFRIYKFRTMELGSGECGPGLTRDGDRRITGMGRWLRKLKLDELPQFYNVLSGEMSLVGPRPKLPQYAGIANMPYRPGITGAATLAFRREEEILSQVHSSQLDAFYDQHIRPLKARIDVRYMCRASLRSDLRLIAATFLACLAPARAPAVLRNAAPRIPVFPLRAARSNSAAKSFETAN